MHKNGVADYVEYVQFRVLRIKQLTFILLVSQLNKNDDEVSNSMN